MKSCSSQKRSFDSAEQAEQALVEIQARRDFRAGDGPVGIYRCDLCGSFHLTSKGPVNATLANKQRDGTIDRQREANYWIDKLDRR